MQPRFVFVSFLFAFLFDIFCATFCPLYCAPDHGLSYCIPFAACSCLPYLCAQNVCNVHSIRFVSCFQPFLFVGYTFALFRAFRFVIRAHNSPISLFTPPCTPLPMGDTPKTSRAEPRLTFPAILIFSEIFFLQNQSLLAIFLFFSCKTMLIRRL